MIPHISEVDAPVVGRTYRVPAILAEKSWKASWFWVPVIGPEHEDAEIIRFPAVHWHIDWRFASRRTIRDLSRAKQYGDEYASWWLIQVIPRTGEIREMAMRCKREMPQFPLSKALWQPALEEAYARHRVNPKCPVCPHRGMPLRGQPVHEVSGRSVWTCPGHGLCWDVTTGELVRT